jgi:hypothetical protein
MFSKTCSTLFPLMKTHSVIIRNKADHVPPQVWRQRRPKKHKNSIFFKFVHLKPYCLAIPKIRGRAFNEGVGLLVSWVENTHLRHPKHQNSLHTVLCDFGDVDVFQASFCLVLDRRLVRVSFFTTTPLRYHTPNHRDMDLSKGLFRRLGKGAMDWLF